MAFGFLKKAVKSVGKVAKGAVKTVGKVAKNPLTTAVAGGLAVVFPPVGVPLAAGVATANMVVKGVNAANPKTKKKAQKVVDNTLKLAAKGNVGAANMATLMNKRAAAMREAMRYKMNDTTGRLIRREGA